VDDFREMRNRIAHNPIILAVRQATGELTLTVVDVNAMDASGITKFKDLNYSKIHSAANRLGRVNVELAEILNSIG